MPDDLKLTAMREHYDRGAELGRLAESFGQQAAGGNPRIQTAVADVRQLDLACESADAVLLLGPLCHLASTAIVTELLTSPQILDGLGERQQRRNLGSGYPLHRIS